MSDLRDLPKPLASFFSHEGTILYSNDMGLERQRVLGFLALALIVDEGARVQLTWRTGGIEGVVAEALARFYSDRPGFKEAVDGLFFKEQQDRLRAAMRGAGGPTP